MTTPAQPGDTEQQDLDQLAARQDRVESKLDHLISVVSKFTGGAPVTHERAQEQTEERLDRPSTVAEQVRAELARADKEKTDASEKETLAQRLAKLEETKPEAPQPRRQKAMWGAR